MKMSFCVVVQKDTLENDKVKSVVGGILFHKEPGITNYIDNWDVNLNTCQGYIKNKMLTYLPYYDSPLYKAING